jgi:hypothetical protein
MPGVRVHNDRLSFTTVLLSTNSLPLNGETSIQSVVVVTFKWCELVPAVPPSISVRLTRCFNSAWHWTVMFKSAQFPQRSANQILERTTGTAPALVVVSCEPV